MPVIALWPVAKIWDVLTTHDLVNLFLRLSLSLGMKHHGKDKYSQHYIALKAREV